MENIFNDVEKDVLYEAICSCGSDLAKEVGRDENEEDVVLVNYLMENVGRYDLVDRIVDKLKANGYKISERSWQNRENDI